MAALLALFCRWLYYAGAGLFLSLELDWAARAASASTVLPAEAMQSGLPTYLGLSSYFRIVHNVKGMRRSFQSSALGSVSLLYTCVLGCVLVLCCVMLVPQNL